MVEFPEFTRLIHISRPLIHISHFKVIVKRQDLSTLNHHETDPVARTNEIVYRDYINIGFAAATPKVRAIDFPMALRGNAKFKSLCVEVPL